jgi:hypothetical protein
MSDLVQAASGGSTQAFALALGAIVLSALVAVVVWLVRDRLDARRRYDSTLEKRLQAGAGKMERLETEVRALHIQAIEMSGRLVSQDHCRDCKRDMMGAISKVSDASDEMKSAVLRLEGRADEGFRQVSRLLSGVVRIPGGGREEPE